jgi:hypothetical protein
VPFGAPGQRAEAGGLACADRCSAVCAALPAVQRRNHRTGEADPPALLSSVSHHSHGPVHLEIVRLAGARQLPPGLDQLVFYLPEAGAQEQITARLAAAGLDPVAQIDYWTDNGGITCQDPDGREVVFASWI